MSPRVIAACTRSEALGEAAVVSRGMTRWALVGVVVLLSGCVKRVTLVAPPIDAPREERVDAWGALRPTALATTTWVDGRHRDRELATDVDTLTLGDGREVGDPRDLLAVVPPDSATARAVADWDRETRRWNTHGWVSLSFLGLGAASLIVLPQLMPRADLQFATAMTSLAVIVLGPLVNLVTALAMGFTRGERRRDRASHRPGWFGGRSRLRCGC